MISVSSILSLSGATREGNPHHRSPVFRVDIMLFSCHSQQPFPSSDQRGRGSLVSGKAQVTCPLDICLGILSRSWSKRRKCQTPEPVQSRTAGL